MYYLEQGIRLHCSWSASSASKPRPSLSLHPSMQHQDSSVLLSPNATLPKSLLLPLLTLLLLSSSSLALSVDLHLHLIQQHHREPSIVKPPWSSENVAASWCKRGTRSLQRAVTFLWQSPDSPRTMCILSPALWRFKSSKTHSCNSQGMIKLVMTSNQNFYPMCYTLWAHFLCLLWLALGRSYNYYARSCLFHTKIEVQATSCNH